MENTTVNAVNAAKPLCGNQMYQISLVQVSWQNNQTVQMDALGY